MSKLILVTGGARSGKSSYAEKLAHEINGKTLYIATAIPYDDEMKDRIKKHQSVRPDTWDTYEGFENLGEYVKKNGDAYECILLDCVTILLTNLLFAHTPTQDFDKITQSEIDAIEQIVTAEVTDLLEAIKAIQSTVILVTNEIGLGLVPEYKLSRIFRDLQGRANQMIGRYADEVYLAVCGIPMKIK